jgi:hypothetical protein
MLKNIFAYNKVVYMNATLAKIFAFMRNATEN